MELIWERKKKLSYRVIIADDEPKILQLIKLLGHWDEYDVEIIDECYDGKQTLESIRKHKPDFVISDIKMPDLDGIELIEETRKAGIPSLFILLSGYRHFEYARSAIALNVVDYLLKPVDEEQLNKTLEKVCRQIAKKKEEEENQEELSRIRNVQNRERLETFWKMLIYNQNHSAMTQHMLTTEMCNENYHTKFQYDSYQIVSMATNLSGILAQHNSLFEDEIEKRMRNFLPGKMVCYYDTNYLGCLFVLNFDKSNRKKVKECVDALYYGIRDLSEVYGSFRLNIGLSGMKSSVRELPEAFLEAQGAEWSRLMIMQNGVIEYAQIASVPRSNPNHIIHEQEIEKAKNCVKYLRREELGILFDELYERISAYSNTSPRDIAHSFFRLKDGACEGAREEMKKQLMENCDYAYLEGKNFRQVIKNLYLQLDQYMEEEQKLLKKKVGKPLGEAVKFIRQHYAESISQEQAAGAGNVSATYLSKLFKEEMNIGFTEYLTQVRLEESEKLLADTMLSIKEIAIAVGYPDEKYYSKLFKKTTGIKPSEYRKIYG